MSPEESSHDSSDASSRSADSRHDSAQAKPASPVQAKGENVPRRVKHITGIVTSDRMQKTRAVQVVRLEKHAKYGKYMRRRTTFKVHDEKDASKRGDVVRIAETRPLSKTKRWRLVEIIRQSKIVTPVGFPEEVAIGGEAESGAASGGATS